MLKFIKKMTKFICLLLLLCSACSLYEEEIPIPRPKKFNDIVYPKGKNRLPILDPYRLYLDPRPGHNEYGWVYFPPCYDKRLFNEPRGDDTISCGLLSSSVYHFGFSQKKDTIFFLFESVLCEEERVYPGFGILPTGNDYTDEYSPDHFYKIVGDSVYNNIIWYDCDSTFKYYIATKKLEFYPSDVVLPVMPAVKDTMKIDTPRATDWRSIKSY